MFFEFQKQCSIKFQIISDRPLTHILGAKFLEIVISPLWLKHPVSILLINCACAAFNWVVMVTMGNLMVILVPSLFLVILVCAASHQQWKQSAIKTVFGHLKLRYSCFVLWLYSPNHSKVNKV